MKKKLIKKCQNGDFTTSSKKQLISKHQKEGQLIPKCQFGNILQKLRQHALNRNITNEQVVDSYINYVLYPMENPNNTGLKDGKYYPYSDKSSPKNIGPGINYTSDMGKGLDYSGKTGYTREELNEKIRPHLLKNMNEIMYDLHNKYGTDVDTMSLGNRLILLDISHNVSPRGNRNNMPNAWPKLTGALVTGNHEEAVKNTRSGSNRRQDMRNQLLWKNIINANTIINK